MERLKFATVWLGGCSGCHMSFLDMDEWLLELAEKVDIVFTPLIDIKEYPAGVDVVLIEGAVANEKDLAMLLKIRVNTKSIIALGDCAVTGNVTAMRNPLGNGDSCLERAYVELADINPSLPSEPGIMPKLLDKVLPIGHVVPVEHYITGCPPDAARIRQALEALLEARSPLLTGKEIRFG
ncbi:MAG: oxidoreductase [Planctomycetota bacterium]